MALKMMHRIEIRKNPAFASMACMKIRLRRTAKKSPNCVHPNQSEKAMPFLKY